MMSSSSSSRSDLSEPDTDTDDSYSDTDGSSISGCFDNYEDLFTQILFDGEEQIAYKEQKWFDKSQPIILLRNVENYIRAKKQTFVTVPFTRHEITMLVERYPYIKKTLETHYPIELPETLCTKRNGSSIRIIGEIKWRLWTLKELATLKLRGGLPMVRYPQTQIEENVLNRALQHGPYMPKHQRDTADFAWLRTYYDGRLMTTALHTSATE